MRLRRNRAVDSLIKTKLARQNKNEQKTLPNLICTEFDPTYIKSHEGVPALSDLCGGPDQALPFCAPRDLGS